MKKVCTMLLMISSIFLLLGCGRENGDHTTTPLESDLIPMIMVNGELYYDTGMTSKTNARCGNMDGEITSTVDGSQMPTVNDQSNFGSGYGYQYGNGTIEVNINDKWAVFERKWVEYVFDDSERGVKFRIEYPESWDLMEHRGWDGDENRDASPSTGIGFTFGDENELFSVLAILFSPTEPEEKSEPFETNTGLVGFKDVINIDDRVYVYYVFGDGQDLPQYTGVVNMSTENYEMKKNDIEAVLNTLKILED